MQLTPGGSIQNYLNRLRERSDPEDLRSSPQRADHLSRVGAILAMEDVEVRLDPAQQTATINTGGGYPGARPDPERWEITITSKGLPQPVTDYSREAYDMLTQETLLVHEIGHALYTDYGALNEACEGLDPEHQAGFRLLFNAAEDAAIEEQLREQFSVAEEIDTLNANLFEAIVPDHHEYTLLQAAELAILELGVWETGRLKGLLDPDAAGGHARRLGFQSRREERLFREEVFPLVRELVKEMKSTPDGGERVDRIAVFWDAFVETLEGADRSPDDGEESPANGVKPDDADPERPGEGRDADALEGNDPSDVDDRADDALGEDGPGEDDDDGDASGGDGGTGDRRDGDDPGEDPPGGDVPDDRDDGDGGEFDDVGAEGSFSVDLREGESRAGDDAEGDDGGPEDDPAPEEGAERAGHEEGIEGGTPGGSVSTSADLEESYAEEAGSDARSMADEDDAMADELEEMQAALEGASDEFAGVNLDVPTDARGRYDEDAYGYADRVSGWIAQELGDRLRIEKRQRPMKRRTAGAIDSKRMMAWDRGDHRIFERRRDGGDKDYHAMFVADRSSSMGGGKVRMLERSVGGMAMGLEEIGVETAVMDLYKDEARLVKPFGVPVEARRSLMFSRDSQGGTALSKVVAIARERLDELGGNRFLVIVTDGQVGETEDFKEQVDRCNFPVLGIYLAPGYKGLNELTYFNSKFDYEGQLALFHRYRTVFDQNGLDRTLRELCREVMF